MASDPSRGADRASTYNGNVIQQVNPNTGAAIGSPLALPGGNSYGLTGLQVLPQAMTLGRPSVPAGSLLVINGYANPDRVNAINSSTGAVVATLILHDNLDANAGVYDAATGDLYLLQGSTNKVAVVDPKTGLTLSQFATPAGVDYWHGGLALGPKQDALWLGSAASNVVYEVNKASGAVILSVDLTSQGVAGIAGLAFNAAGQLLVASTDGVVFVVNLTTQAQFALLLAHASGVAASSQAAALTSEELSPVVNAAIELWAAAGISPAELDELRQVTVRITDLPGAYLGLSAPDTVYIDPNADGYGWFIDADPQDGRAFTSTGPGGEMVATQASPAWGHIDLLTVVAHELGHQLGLGDDASDDLMGEFLSLGVRRLPDGPGLHSGAIAPTGSPTTVTTALAASAGTTTRATIPAVRAETTTTGATTLARSRRLSRPLTSPSSPAGGRMRPNPIPARPGRSSSASPRPA